MNWPDRMRSVWAGPSAPWSLIGLHGQHVVLCPGLWLSSWFQCPQMLALIHTLRSGVLAPSRGRYEHGAVPKTSLLGIRRTCTQPDSPVCFAVHFFLCAFLWPCSGLGNSPLPCFIWPARHRITSFSECPHGLPGKWGCCFASCSDETGCREEHCIVGKHLN